ncbi:MAG: hypothetical protein EZS28_014792 [Streblomastix strix]|uniref:Uncharacterized protein n=1 Tax=Streblomastix strix TaxID=222440 RepID=A0A5J4W430_9EUKA|nr:MAG: hypothetical protein EZS28_014792 [Streblomastix strix]
MSRFSPAQLSAAIKVRAACITGDLDTLKEMVKQDHTIVQTPYEYGKTPLSIAASWGHDELIQFLIDEGADINHADEIGWVPLHWAAFTGNLDTCHLLINQGADYMRENKAHQTPLDFEKAEKLRDEINKRSQGGE